MSDTLNTGSTTARKLVVAGVGGAGKKATAINFLKDANGVREWAWLPNEVAAVVRAGTVVVAGAVSESSTVETTYTDQKTGVVVALKVPKRQLFLGGKIVIQAPASDPLPAADFTVTDEAKVYASRVDAKQVASAATSVASGDEAF